MGRVKAQRYPPGRYQCPRHEASRLTLELPSAWPPLCHCGATMRLAAEQLTLFPTGRYRRGSPPARAHDQDS